MRRLLKAFADAHLSQVTNEFYDGARHELVNETNRDEATRDLIVCAPVVSLNIASAV